MKRQELVFLAFLQEQMEIRKSSENGKIGTDDRATTEYLVLSMVWEEYLHTKGIYFSEMISGNKAHEVWKEVFDFRNKEHGTQPKKGDG